MRCPRCGFENGLSQGKCARCNSEVSGKLADASFRGFTPIIPATGLLSANPPMRGDVLHDGQYRLMIQVNLPETQRKQGTAWSAIDLKNSHRRVVIREIPVTREMTRGGAAERVAYTAMQIGRAHV